MPLFPPVSARCRYGLSEAELLEVEEQLQEIAAQRQAGGGGAGPAVGGAALQDGKAGGGGRVQRDAELLGAKDGYGVCPLQLLSVCSTCVRQSRVTLCSQVLHAAFRCTGTGQTLRCPPLSCVCSPRQLRHEL